MIRFLASTLFLVLFLLTGCGNGEPNERQRIRYELGDRPRSADGQTLDLLNRPTANQNAMIRGIRYTQGDFDFTIANFQLGEETPGTSGLPCAQDPSGQHIRMIIDDQPAVKYTQPKFRHELSDGEHYMVTFLTTSYGESVKVQNAARIAKIVAKDNNFTAMENISQPMIFLNMTDEPIQQAAAGEGVLLDFFLINGALGVEYSVQVILDGSTIAVNNWQPYLMRNLSPGEHQLELRLLGRTGELVNSPYNPVKRSFSIIE